MYLFYDPCSPDTKIGINVPPMGTHAHVINRNVCPEEADVCVKVYGPWMNGPQEIPPKLKNLPLSHLEVSQRQK